MRVKKLSAKEIDTIVLKANLLKDTKNINAVAASKGVYYDLKGDAFIMMYVKPKVASTIWECMGMPKKGVNNGYDDMVNCDEVMLDITITKLGGILPPINIMQNYQFILKKTIKI